MLFEKYFERKYISWWRQILLKYDLDFNSKFRINHDNITIFKNNNKKTHCEFLGEFKSSIKCVETNGKKDKQNGWYWYWNRHIQSYQVFQFSQDIYSKLIFQSLKLFYYNDSYFSRNETTMKRKPNCLFETWWMNFLSELKI